MECQNHNLSKPDQEKLRSLLDSPALEVLFTVLESEAFNHEVEAANAAVMNTAGYDTKAKDEAGKANLVHGAIALLQKLKAQKEPFKISSASPTKTTNTT